VGVEEIQLAFNRKAGDGSESAFDSSNMASHMQGDLTDSLPDQNSISSSFSSVSNTLKQFTDINYLKSQLLNYLFLILLPAITNFINFMITLAIERLTKL